MSENNNNNNNLIQLENGNYLYFNYGKYKSGLTFIISNPDAPLGYFTDKELDKQLNLLYTGDASFLRGKFFVSKKGSYMFDLTTDKPHILIRVGWGGAFNRTRGFKSENLPVEKIYFRRASSNGGGAGYDYLILPADYKHKYSLDDF